MSVVVIDDHPALRQGLVVLLERRGFEVLGATGSAAGAEELLDGMDPDVIVLDLGLPDEGGVSLARRLLAQEPSRKLVFYTGLDDLQTIVTALQVGAAGYVSKVAGLDELVVALRAAKRGTQHLDPRIEQLLYSGRRSGAGLSPREREILSLLADGLSGAEVADRLVLSPETVRTHVRNSMAKLEARTRAAAVAAAIRRGEIEPTD